MSKQTSFQRCISHAELNYSPVSRVSDSVRNAGHFRIGFQRMGKEGEKNGESGKTRINFSIMGSRRQSSRY